MSELAGLTVRFATPSDAPEMIELIRGLAVFERESPDRVRATPEDLVRDGFNERPFFEALIAERAGRVIGFALFFPHYSTWEGRPGLFIEDLFVVEEERRTGAGRALLTACARIAHERGWARLELSVLDWNPARAFYEAHGMSHQQEWLPYRMDAEEIARVASEASQID
jgi:GNAT superfamily N-acetyltransferase